MIVSIEQLQPVLRELNMGEVVAVGEMEGGSCSLSFAAKAAGVKEPRLECGWTSFVMSAPSFEHDPGLGAPAMLAFSDDDQRRRRSGPERTVTVAMCAR
ncbi:MAG: hypothetical protein GEV13_31710 [Rhodospirillales bacterium]|nr:hypothetical protein [Rhodospirillales bacterium]